MQKECRRAPATPVTGKEGAGVGEGREERHGGGRRGQAMLTQLRRQPALARGQTSRLVARPHSLLPTLTCSRPKLSADVALGKPSSAANISYRAKTSAS
eukprot:328325-Chlamydomonas_euryale.AAC.1